VSIQVQRIVSRMRFVVVVMQGIVSISFFWKGEVRTRDLFGEVIGHAS
jgi:hypothetical protein